MAAAVARRFRRSACAPRPPDVKLIAAPAVLRNALSPARLARALHSQRSALGLRTPRYPTSVDGTTFAIR